MNGGLRNQVTARLTRFRQGQREAVLGLQAAQEAGLLARRAMARASADIPDGDALEDLTAAGLLHYYRYVVPAGEAQRRDFALAVKFLTPVVAVHPGRAPPLVRDVVGAMSGGPGRPDATPEDLLHVGVGLLFFVQEFGGGPALESAIRLLTRAEQASPASGRLRVRCLNALGNAHRRRWRITADPEALRQAVNCNRAALAAHDGPVEERAGLQHSLGNALREFGAYTMDASIVAEAVDAARNAARLAPESAMYLNGLSLALRMRYRFTGEGASLREAAAAGRRACEMVPGDHPDRAVYLNGLSQALCTLDRTGLGEPDTLAEAIACARECVQSTPEDHPDLARHLDQCAIALEQAAHRAGDSALMQEAVTAERKAVAVAARSGADHWPFTANLAAVLAGYHRLTGVTSLLSQARQLAQAAVDHLPAGGPDHALALNCLGRILLALGRDGPRPNLLRQARAMLERVAADPAAATHVRLEAARDSGRSAAEVGDWPGSPTLPEHSCHAAAAGGRPRRAVTRPGTPAVAIRCPGRRRGGMRAALRRCGRCAGPAGTGPGNNACPRS